MKFSTLAKAIWLLPATLARSVYPRDNIESITDEYLFKIDVPQFIAYRAAKEPSTVNWSSDGCTLSVDNPMGFNFEPACNRHDFGYTNYRDQHRFNEDTRALIDSKFLTDLKYQCTFEYVVYLCDGLAMVYHAAVRAFGGVDNGLKRSESEAVAAYREKLAAYKQMLTEAQANGIVPL
ncbi:hypothetical protein VM1G_07753 [Cytospora mali]|uniref:Phospholipase A2 n=1 Tax=Cytospora mali TaxID=578113 RepID=A0A194W623_CYTMA|nr:hypothetical protein VM1G_07753 [Valsa mali]